MELDSRRFGTALLAWMFAACSGGGDHAGTIETGTSIAAVTIAGGGTADLDTTLGIGMISMSLSAGTHTIETRNCTAGTDSVIHLLRAGSQVDFDDNSGAGLHSLVTHTVAWPGGAHQVLVRAASDTTNGTCTLFRDGVSLGSISAGGRRVDLGGLEAGEILETVDTDGATHRILLLNGSSGFVQLATGGGVGTGARLTVAASSATTLRAIVGATAPVKFVRNDLLAGHDPDGDGLGEELEAAIGTCSRVYGIALGFDCGWLKDAKDTDADGLSDAWELFGVEGSGPTQRLPLWGANPRHKDLFIEVDFMKKLSTDTDVLMQPEVARQVAEIYAAELGSPSLAERDHIAATLKNPDGLPGVALHFDTGMDPIDPADEHLYGDWGGHNTVEPASPGVGRPDRISADPSKPSTRSASYGAGRAMSW